MPIYSGLTSPSEAAAFHPTQAGYDPLQQQAILAGLQGCVVVSGCAVSAQGTPNMTVAVGSGVVGSPSGAAVAVSSGNVTISAADPSNPRIDLVVAAFSNGTKSVLTGAPAPPADSTHSGPIWPAAFDATTYAVLAEVYIPAGQTSITAPLVTDKRVIGTPTGTYVPSVLLDPDGTAQDTLIERDSTTHPPIKWIVTFGNSFSGNGFTFFDPTLGFGHNINHEDPSKPSAGLHIEGDYWNNANAFTAGWTHAHEAYVQFTAAVNFGTTIAAASNGATLPQGTINVASTAGFTTSGSFTVGADTVAYTGLTATTFTGCTGGTGTLSTGEAVTPVSQLVTRPWMAAYDWTSNKVAFSQSWDQLSWQSGISPGKNWLTMPTGQNKFFVQVPIQIDSVLATSPVTGNHAQFFMNAPTAKQNQLQFSINSALKWEVDFSASAVTFTDSANARTTLLLHAGAGGAGYAEFGVNILMDEGMNMVLGTATGTKIGTAGGAAGQKLGFFNAVPIVQPLLATGAAHTVDDVITTLQTIGLVRQS